MCYNLSIVALQTSYLCDHVLAGIEPQRALPKHVCALVSQYNPSNLTVLLHQICCDFVTSCQFVNKS